MRLRAPHRHWPNQPLRRGSSTGVGSDGCNGPETLGTAIAAGFNALTLLVLLRGRVGGLDGRRLAVASIKISIAAAIMGAVALQMAHALERWLPGDGEWTRAVRVGAAIGAAIVALVAVARLLRIEEFTEAINRVLRRMPGRR